MVITVSTVAMLAFDQQYEFKAVKKKRAPWLVNLLFALVIALILANIVNVLMECGLRECPDNPVSYLWKL
jgi:uncharacterized membrane protein